MNPQDVATAFKAALDGGVDAQVYDYLPDSPNYPAICVVMDPGSMFPYDVTAPTTFVIWCMVGTVEEQGAQAKLDQWLSDDDNNSIVAILDANNTLDGVVSSVLPVGVRNWGIHPVREGGPRVLQAELVCNVWR